MSVNYVFKNRKPPEDQYDINAKELNANFDSITTGSALDDGIVVSRLISNNTITYNHLHPNLIDQLRFGIQGALSTYADLIAIDPGVIGVGVMYIIESDENRGGEQNTVYQSDGANWNYIITMLRDTGEIKTSAADPTYGYLDEKLEGNALEIDSNKLALKDTIAGARTFTDNIIFSNNITVGNKITSKYLVLNAGATISEFSVDTALAGNSDGAVPTEKAVKTYVDDTFAAVATPDHNDLPLIQGGQANEYYHFTSGEHGDLVDFQSNVNAQLDQLNSSGAPSFNGATINGNISLNTGTLVDDISIDGTLIDNSDDSIVTEKAIKSYVDTEIAGFTTDHNSLTSLQGGQANEYYHLSSGDYSVVTPFVNHTNEQVDQLNSSGSPVFAGMTVSGSIVLDNGTSVNEFSTDGALAGNSDSAVPTEKAVKTYVDAGGGGLSFLDFDYSAGDFDYPGVTDLTDADLDGIAELLTDTGTNADIKVHAMDDADDEGVKQTLKVPGNLDTAGTVYFEAIVYTPNANSGDIVMRCGHSAKSPGTDSWDIAYTHEDSAAATISIQDQIETVSWNATVSSLGWSADDMIDFIISRASNLATDTLTGDLYFKHLRIKIPIS